MLQYSRNFYLKVQEHIILKRIYGLRLITLYVHMLICVIASESESDISPEKRARVGEVPEGEESSSSSSSLSASSPSSSSSSRSGSKQRSRKRCHRCQTKLELVQQELGSCRCGMTTQLYINILFRTRISKHAQEHTH